MTIFRLKQLASTSAHAVAGAVRWNYDRAELIAEKIRSYQDAGLQYLILDPTQHSASAEALEAIEFFAHEVQPLLN